MKAIYFCLNILCTYMAPTRRSVNTVNWRSGSQLTFSPVWDISLPFQTMPCNTLFPSHTLSHLTTSTMDQYHAILQSDAGTVHWNISPQFKTLPCYKFPINIAHFTSMYKYTPSCVWYTCSSLLLATFEPGLVYLLYLPPLPISPSNKGWLWELLEEGGGKRDIPLLAQK